MSASLVGSEMCIRDSLPTGPSGQFPDPLTCSPRCPHSSHWCAPRTAPGAVSYTHLTLPTICSV
eukprot:6583979-Alexandrium_andersonii.AAC.1